MCTLSTAVRDVTAQREQEESTAVCWRINYWNWHPYCISIFIRSNFTVQRRRHLSSRFYIFLSHIHSSLRLSCRGSVAPPTGRANKTKAKLNFELPLSLPLPLCTHSLARALSLSFSLQTHSKRSLDERAVKRHTRTNQKLLINICINYLTVCYLFIYFVYRVYTLAKHLDIFGARVSVIIIIMNVRAAGLLSLSVSLPPFLCFALFS